MQKLNDLRMSLYQRPTIGIGILSAFYFFGAFGIIVGFEEWFVRKTAFNLMLSFLLLICYQKTLDYRFIIALAACYIIGFTAEFLGVQYGLIFGNYHYPTTLGPQLFDVPIIIGVNWFLLTFAVWAMIQLMNLPSIAKVLLASLLTTLIDVMIEPVAITLDFWQWEGGLIPLQNYLGWGIISLIIFTIYQLIGLPTRNRLVNALLIWQLLFFLSLNIWLSFLK